ncbi:MAG: SDR family NAD(P)-dependent oxidoreductase [Verrucomicrobia bacterium]|nr:SDR family NAD(P)-dependent oxidoreductase [Verrucomicrobiota bacterium]
MIPLPSPPASDPANLVALLRGRARAEPGRRAYLFLQDGEIEAAAYTYAQLDERARSVAARLQRHTQAGDRALLLYPPGLEFLAAFFGCLYARVIAVPSYPPKRNRPDHRLQGIAADAGARVVLTNQAVLAEIEARLQHTPELKALQWLATDARGAANSEAWCEPPVRPADLAFLQYTSGSTSTPKGVMVSHRNLLVTLDDLDRGWQHTPDSVMVTWLPIFHDLGLIYGALMPLYKGFPCVLLPPPAFLQRPSRWLRAITHYRGTHSAAPNFAYDLCVAATTPEQRAEFDLRSWHLSLNAAEPVRAETLVAFNEAFAPCGLAPLTVSPGYGLAEATLKVCALPCSEPTRLCHVVTDELARHRVVPGPPGAPGVQPIVGCGWGQINNRYCIVDPETRRLCPPAVVGEIWFAGPAVAQGYWNRPEETEQSFGARLADTGEGPFLRTGDLGFLHEGQLFVTGRIKDVIIIRGLNHYPQDIELTVEKCHAALRPAGGAAFSVEVGGREALVIAQEVERTWLRKLNLDDVVSAIRQAVAERHELPVQAVALLRTGSIPKTSSGKIQRRACRALYLDGQLELVGEWRQPAIAAAPGAEGGTADAPVPAGEAVAPSDNAVELAVVETWLTLRVARRLKLPASAIDPKEPFSHYGLDSLAAVEVSGELEKSFGRRLPPTLLYDYPSIRLLAAHLAVVAASPPPPEDAVAERAHGPVAIVGLGCRFPGADSPASFWQMLAQGVDAISPVPASRWTANGGAPPWGGFISAVDGFDSEFFGIAPREADLMDPQQRLLLEVCWEALEDAGLAADALAGSRAGVFLGLSTSDYQRLLATRPGGTDAHAGTGNALSIAANRVSYLLDLRGPSWVVDTACSSSLVAVHQACRSLRSGECSLALVGGVNLMLAPDLTTTFARAGMLAADGRCKTFDAAADGYVRGEGCGIVVLKRLADAQRDGDRVLAVIRGTAVNQDGRSNGLTAPNGPAQQAVVRAALRDADLIPEAISCVETHGTGTALGDPIEVNSLKEVLLGSRTVAQPCWLGSVKANIGHLEAAAGIAGLIKTVLALQHRKIPPQLHLRRRNPLIALEGTPFVIPTTLIDWPEVEGNRYAGVSSFGFGGTNAHVVLGEAPGSRTVPAETMDTGGEVLVLSARSGGALRALARRLGEHLTAADAAPWPEICRTAATGRAALPHRLALPAVHDAEAAEKLLAFAQGGAPIGLSQRVAVNRPRVAFLYSGQGSPYAGMGLELRTRNDVYRAAFEECRATVCQHAGWDLAEVVESAAKLARPEFGQVALFAVQFALGRLWADWGVVPDAVVGHSAGEFAAACLAGVLGHDEALKLLLARARLMAATGATGAMAAVHGTEADVAGVLARTGLELAAVNAPRQIVLTGERSAVQAAVAELRAAGLRVQMLEVCQGYHSRQMEPMLAEFGMFARNTVFGAPRGRFISTVTGHAASAELADAEYWVRQVRQPVRFAEAMNALRAERIDLLVEIGPRGTLLGLGQQSWPAGEGEWLLSLRPGCGEVTQMHESAARAWVLGAPVDWRRIHRRSKRPPVALPTYPFQRQRHWFDDPAPSASPASSVDLTRAEELVAELQSDPELSPADRAALPRVLAALARRQPHAESGDALRGLTYELRWYPRLPPAAAPVSPAGSWLLLGALGPISAGLATELEKRGGRTQVAEEFVAGEWRGVVMIADREEKAEAAVFRLAAIAQAMIAAQTPARLWVVTDRAVAVTADDAAKLALGTSSLWGCGRVIALEHPEIWGGQIDFVPGTGTGGAQLADELLAPDGEDQLALRADRRFALRLERRDVPASPGLRLRAEASYWVTGGLGALGLQVARWLGQRGARQLVLTGRRPPSPAAEQVIAELRGAGVRVLILQADVAELPDVQRVLETAASSFGPVRGVVHAAGTVSSCAIEALTEAGLRLVLRPKVAGAAALHEATRELELDFFVLFSSIAAVWGSKGQAHYAAANRFLDALAQHRRALGLPALSVNWGPWGGGGMAGAEELAWLARLGVTAMPPEEACAALDRLLGGGATSAVVARVDWRVFREVYEVRGPRPLLANLGTRTDAGPPAPVAPSPAVAALSGAPESERLPRLVALLQEEVGAVLGFRHGRRPDPRQGFFALGMDSLMAVELRNRLARAFARRLPATLAFDHANIEALADYLASAVLGWSPPAEAIAATGTDGATGALPEPVGADLDAALAARLGRLESLIRNAS